MEHLETKFIIEVLDRLVGDIHAYGETNHDNQAYENLKTYEGVFHQMLSELCGISINIDSYMGSVQRNSEKALKILIEARNEINDYLVDYDKEHSKYYVSIYHSFDKECPLYMFDNKEEAQTYIEKQYLKEIENAEKDDCAKVKKSTCKEGFAQIVYDNDTNDDIEWSVCQAIDYWRD